MATWLVTGANRGIGLELAQELAARGERVIGTARRPAAAAELRATGARVEELDVSSDASVAALAARLEGERLALDVLVNNAAVGKAGSELARLEPEELRRTFEVNALGPLRVTRALLPALERGGRRLVASLSSELGSVASNRGGGWYAYRASKAALGMLMVTAARELAPRGFTLVLLSPGWVRTDMGGPQAPLSPAESVRGLLAVLGRLRPEDSGRFLDHRGEVVPW